MRYMDTFDDWMAHQQLDVRQLPDDVAATFRVGYERALQNVAANDVQALFGSAPRAGTYLHAVAIDDGSALWLTRASRDRDTATSSSCTFAAEVIGIPTPPTTLTAPITTRATGKRWTVERDSDLTTSRVRSTSAVSTVTAPESQFATPEHSIPY